MPCTTKSSTAGRSKEIKGCFDRGARQRYPHPSRKGAQRGSSQHGWEWGLDYCMQVALGRFGWAYAVSYPPFNRFLCACVMDCRGTGSSLFCGAICRPPCVALALFACSSARQGRPCTARCGIMPKGGGCAAEGRIRCAPE